MVDEFGGQRGRGGHPHRHRTGGESRTSFLPAASSEAQAQQVTDDARTTIHYYFPVEIEVVAAGAQVDEQRIADLGLENSRDPSGNKGLTCRFR